jgi:hypothetical protein
MRDWFDYAKKYGIELRDNGRCQFCNANVSGGVFECQNNLNHLTAILDFNNPVHLQSRFLSVDAMALQHCELHGPWNNHIHLTRLWLIFEKSINWDYTKTPLLSNIINAYKKDRSEYLSPPQPGKRGDLTTADLLKASTPEECIRLVKDWAYDVYNALHIHHGVVSVIGDNYLQKYG